MKLSEISVENVVDEMMNAYKRKGTRTRARQVFLLWDGEW